MLIIWIRLKFIPPPWKAAKLRTAPNVYQMLPAFLTAWDDAIAIRCYGDPVDWEYGGAHAMLREFARWADIPVLIWKTMFTIPSRAWLMF